MSVLSSAISGSAVVTAVDTSEDVAGELPPELGLAPSSSQAVRPAAIPAISTQARILLRVLFILVMFLLDCFE